MDLISSLTFDPGQTKSGYTREEVLSRFSRTRLRRVSVRRNLRGRWIGNDIAAPCVGVIPSEARNLAPCRLVARHHPAKNQSEIPRFARNDTASLIQSVARSKIPERPDVGQRDCHSKDILLPYGP